MAVAVGDIMTRAIVSVSPDTKLSLCAKKLVSNGINTLLVAENHRLLGIITSTDILNRVTKHENLSHLYAKDIATKRVAVIHPGATIHEALMKMREFNFRRLPVIADGLLVGVITLKDILRVDPSLYADLGELASIREEEKKLTKAQHSFSLEGFCENCGAFAELANVNGLALCSDCRAEIAL